MKSELNSFLINIWPDCSSFYFSTFNFKNFNKWWTKITLYINKEFFKINTTSDIFPQLVYSPHLPYQIFIKYVLYHTHKTQIFNS